MPIDTRCPTCGGKFQAPDKLLGKRVKCPRCSGVIQVADAGRSTEKTAGPKNTSPSTPSPSPAQASLSPPQPPVLPPQPTDAPAPKSESQAEPDAWSWHVLTTDDERLGPLAKTQIEALLGQGRLDSFCRVRREDWDDWKWLEEAFSASGEGDEAASEDRHKSSAIASGDSSRLRPCPDCERMISRRASQCPHCGYQPRGKKPWVIGAIVATLLIFSIGSAWMIYRRINDALNTPLQQVESLLRSDLTVEPTPPADARPRKNTESGAKSFDAWAKEASDAMATELDTLYRQIHSVDETLRQAQASAKLIESLLEPQPSRKRPDEPLPVEPKPYQSKYQSLYNECLRHVRDTVPADKADWDAVHNAARRWADAKRAPLEKQLEDRVQGSLGL